MDLIYATPEKVDIGILQDYEFDLAYGSDENDFELTLALRSHCCQDDYIVYMVDSQNNYEEATEYGGIIDSITVDTDDQTVTYSGRTWQGILSEKVIQPEDTQDYKIVTGDAHDIMRELIDDLDIGDFFTVPDGVANIDIPEYQFERYVDAYDGISDMLHAAGAKLKIVYDHKQVVMSAVWLTDYSMSDEWDSSQVNFTIKKRINPINHLICLGQGSLRNRYKIHLFTDVNGGIQDYATVDSPIEDADYILDTSQQLLFGSEEICEAYDYPSAGIAENYVPLTVQPDDWSWNFGAYYYRDDDRFKEVERVSSQTLIALASQPSDWSTKYADYFTSNGKSVQGVESTTYRQINKKPSDWKKNYNQYYEHFWDGTQYVWQAVSGVTHDTYKAQTKKPSDWTEHYSSYYQHKVITEVVKDKSGKIVYVKDPKTGRKKQKKTTKIGKGYETVKAVKKGKTESAPTWQKGKFFTKYSKTLAPSFSAGLDKYEQVKTTSAPTFTAGTYYRKTTVYSAPVFKPRVHYRMALDHYAELVAYGIKKLREENARGDTIQIDLNLLGEYDIGDIVGAREETTGIEVWQPITKKVVKLNNNKRTISYRIGDIKI